MLANKKNRHATLPRSLARTHDRLTLDAELNAAPETRPLTASPGPALCRRTGGCSSGSDTPRIRDIENLNVGGPPRRSRPVGPAGAQRAWRH